MRSVTGTVVLSFFLGLCTGSVITSVAYLVMEAGTK